MDTLNQPKITVGSRMDPELKEQLEEEANAAGKTLSGYIENLLILRDNVNVDVNELKNRLFELEAENLALKTSAGEIGNEAIEDNSKAVVRALKTQRQELLEQLRRVSGERDVLARFQSAGRPGWLSDEAYRVVMDYLKKLIQKYPDVELQTMMLSVLEVTWKNANSAFLVYTLEDYWSKNPSHRKPLKP